MNDDMKECLVDILLTVVFLAVWYVLFVLIHTAFPNGVIQ